jgi:glycosyltransferase involved in cell wall biosynthesis
MPDVSVIIPCKVGEIRVLDAIKSIYDQRITMEILVGIDGNDSVLKNKTENLKLNGLRVYEYIKPIGTTKILNDLISKSQGQYIARMDADDLSLPNRIKIQLDFMNKNTRVDLMCSNAYQKNGTLLIKGESRYLSAKDFLKGNPVIHPTVFFKNEYFKRLGFKYNEKWKRAQDYELWTRFIRFGSIYFSSDPMINYQYDFKIKNFSRQFFFFNMAFSKNFVWSIFKGRSDINNKDLISAFFKLITTPITYLKIVIWNLNNAK